MSQRTIDTHTHILTQETAALLTKAGVKVTITPDDSESAALERFVDRDNDIGDAGVVPVMREQVPASRPAHAFDKAAAAQTFRL